MIGENTAVGLQFASDYVTLIAQADLSRVSQRQRDPNKVKRLLQSLARNISTEASLTALSRDTGGKVFHYRDSRGTEADAIVEYADGTWGAFEVKLGIGAVDEAAGSLKTLVNKIDTDRVKAPAALTVITGNGFAYRRPDGINVVPISTLTV